MSVTFEDASAGRGPAESRRSGQVRCESYPSRISTGALAAERTFGPPARSARFCSVPRRRFAGNVRLEFLCGNRAIRRARADFTALGSCGPFLLRLAGRSTGSCVATQAEKLKDADKFRRKLESELGELRGRMLYAKTEANGRGLKVHSRLLSQGPFPDDIRAEANSFVAEGHAVFHCNHGATTLRC